MLSGGHGTPFDNCGLCQTSSFEKREDEMVTFYASSRGEHEARLLNIIQKAVPGEGARICRDIHALSDALRQPGGGKAIAILFASTRNELQEILSLRELLGDMKIILVLPDGSTDTVAKGHSLRPRFMSYGDGDFQDIAAVLKRMFENLTVNHKH